MKLLRMKEKKMNISSCVLWWPAQEIGESKSNNPTTVFMDLQIFICELPVYSHRESRKKKKKALKPAVMTLPNWEEVLLKPVCTLQRFMSAGKCSFSMTQANNYIDSMSHLQGN